VIGMRGDSLLRSEKCRYFLVSFNGREDVEEILRQLSSVTEIYGVGRDPNNPTRIRYVVCRGSRIPLKLEKANVILGIGDKYLLSGPRVLVEYGLNAFCDDILVVEPDRTMRERANGVFLCLEDTIATTFYHAIKYRPSWLRYIVMIYVSRRVDIGYLLNRCRLLGIENELRKFLGLIFRTFRGEWSGDRAVRIGLSHPRFRHIVDYFNHLHWYEIFSDVESFYGITPEVIVSLAGKQLFGY